LIQKSTHGGIVKLAREQLADIFEKSDQSVYVYLDDGMALHFISPSSR
jgi:hypothetical protein